MLVPPHGPHPPTQSAPQVFLSLFLHIQCGGALRWSRPGVLFFPSLENKQKQKQANRGGKKGRKGKKISKIGGKGLAPWQITKLWSIKAKYRNTAARKCLEYGSQRSAHASDERRGIPCRASY